MASRRNVRVGAIENAGPNTLRTFLQNTGRSAKQIDIAVAFLTSAGLNSILYLLTRRGTRVRVLTGLYQGFTEPSALRTLLQAERGSKGRLSVRISTNPRFHWKAYFLVGPRSADVVVGSSNLTLEGLANDSEFNLHMTVAISSNEYATVHGVFDRNWNTKSKPLSQAALKRYEDWRKDSETEPRPPVPLRQILGGNPDRLSVTKQEDQRFWRTCVDGDLSEATEDLLCQTTNWERRGLYCFSTWSPTFRVDDRVILFDFGGKRISVIKIVVITRTPRNTPDGVHFAAYQLVRGMPQPRLASRLKILKAAKLVTGKRDAEKQRKLRPAKFDQFVENLKRKA